MKKLKDLFSGYVRNKLNEQEKKIMDMWYDSRAASAQENQTENEADEFSEEAWKKFEEWQEQKSRQRRLPRPWIIYGGVAAAIALLVLTLRLPDVLRNSENVLMAKTELQYTESGDKQLSITLDDGTKITLNKGSKFRVIPGRFDSNIREVELAEGEAFFDVARDENRPFIVHTPNGIKTQVLGTSFNITAYKELNEQTVTVLTGLVKVSDEKDRSVLVNPNFRTTYHKEKGGALSTLPIDASQSVGWMSGISYLNNAAPDELALRIKQIYNVSLSARGVIDPQEKINITLSQDIPLQEIAQGLADIYHANARIENGTLVFTKQQQ